MRSDEGSSRKNALNASRILLQVIIVIGMSYGLLVVASILLSTYFVDKAFQVSIREEMVNIGCHRPHSGEGANPLNIWVFYSNLDYWLADYRAPQEVISDAKCMSAVVARMSGRKRPVSVVFVNGTGDVTLAIRSQKQPLNFQTLP